MSTAMKPGSAKVAKSRPVTQAEPDAAHEPAAAVGKVIREPDFARRLTQAADGNPMVPPKHNGRLGWVRQALLKQFKLVVSNETVRKWFEGEAKPRPDKMGPLAEVLQVDVAWLSLGVSPDMEPRERKARNAQVDGAVNLVAGLIQMDGGSPAFPDEHDLAAEQDHVDLHAIIRGGKYDIHVNLGQEEGGKLRFSAPTSYQKVVVLGVVKRGFVIEIYEITPELIEVGNRHGGSIEVVVDPKDARLRKVESFKNRL